MNRVLVAGIGNVFLGDDAFGVEVARRMAAGEVPDGVDVADFGIAGMHLAYQLTDGYQAAVLIDAAPRGGRPGDLYVIEPEPDPAGEGEGGLDAHGMHPEAVLRMVEILGGGPERVVVVGHGLGGAVGVHLVALDGRRVAGLALLDAPLHADAWPVAGALPMLVPGIRAICARALPVVPWLAEWMLAQAVGRGSDVRDMRPLDRYVEALRAPGAARGLVHFLTAVDPVATEAAWHIVRAAPPPTLVMWGAEDRVHNLSYGRRIAGEIPSAAWVPVAGAGHLLPEEHPARVAEELVAFHAEVSGD